MDFCEHGTETLVTLHAGNSSRGPNYGMKLHSMDLAFANEISEKVGGVHRAHAVRTLGKQQQKMSSQCIDHGDIFQHFRTAESNVYVQPIVPMACSINSERTSELLAKKKKFQISNCITEIL